MFSYRIKKEWNPSYASHLATPHLQTLLSKLNVRKQPGGGTHLVFLQFSIYVLFVGNTCLDFHIS